ncbi:MAG: protein kinase domain-containing protein [Pyrinomonadaceae bacterium]
MRPERWQQVSRIFEAALELGAEERLAYVEAQCGPDESLRREVELLIQSHKDASEENFIEGHAFERAAPVLAAGETEPEERKDGLSAGQEVGHYRIIEKIGAGGMGEVYLARDARLDRTVALKILPADVASDQRRMLRFKQEARSVSALNQPNILTIFDFGETESLYFIAAEYIDGETLRRRIRGKRIRLLEAIDIGIQIAAALDAAHDAKIMHRDIKPENIMIRRRDALVKVLDFGLAKLTEKGAAPGQSTDMEAATEVLLKTKPGSVLGTVNYMSPEQAQGHSVDERTDLWSTGVVLYEMLGGHTPFSGKTSSHTVVEILEKEPAALTNVPAELERIIRKALAKNVNERYQTAKDLLIDLKNLRKRLEVEAEIERSSPPPFASKPPAPAEGVQTDKNLQAKATSENVPTASGGSDARAHSPSKRFPLPAFMVAGLLVGCLAIGFSAWRFSQSSPLPPAPAPISERQLNYWMMVQKYRDGKPFETPFRLASEINFEKDYRVQLNVSSPQSGYLYIFNEGPSGAEGLSVLFPSPTANSGSALLAENQQVRIPSESWFQFDAQQGTEDLWLIFSPAVVPELEAVKSFANPRDKGVINNPELSRAVRAFIAANSNSKPAVERSDDRKETSVRSGGGKVIAYLIKLEHH